MKLEQMVTLKINIEFLVPITGASKLQLVRPSHVGVSTNYSRPWISRTISSLSSSLVLVKLGQFRSPQNTTRSEERRRNRRSANLSKNSNWLFAGDR